MTPTVRTITWLILTIAFSGCTLKASTETASDAITNFVSSTTPGSWVTRDGLLRPDMRVKAFVTANAEQLQADMAQGSGEYLESLSTLLSVPGPLRPTFNHAAQRTVQEWRNASTIAPTELLSTLTALAATTTSRIHDAPLSPNIQSPPHLDTGKDT